MRSGHVHLVADGMLTCPRDGLRRDVDACGRCPWFAGLGRLEGSGETLAVCCAPGGAYAGDEFAGYTASLSERLTPRS